MPKRKKLYVNTRKMLLWEAVDQCMFSYVLGIQTGLPSVGLQQAIELFMDKFNLHEDIYPLEQAKQRWYRLHQDYVEDRKLDI